MALRFLQLFQRGRYVSIHSLAAAEADKSTRDRKHHERERFSVAAIAFCLEHDKSFRRHFLKIIADLSPEQIPSVSLEPEQWGDLLLEGPRHILVLEFKLGALLQEHQAPDARIFSITGYGAKIRERFGKSGKTLRYIVVGKDFQSCNRADLACSAVSWRKLLVPRGRKESNIEKDLYDCLGHLGAPVFLNRHMKTPKLTHDARRAMKVYATIHHVLAAEDIPIGGSGSDSASVGVQILRARSTRGSLHNKLVKAVQPTKRTLAWIGYELLEEDETPCLSVWFNSTPKTSSKVRARLEAVKGLGVVEKFDNSEIYIRLRGNQSADDAEWFKKVLGVAAGI